MSYHGKGGCGSGGAAVKGRTAVDGLILAQVKVLLMIVAAGSKRVGVLAVYRVGIGSIIDGNSVGDLVIHCRVGDF